MGWFADNVTEPFTDLLVSGGEGCLDTGMKAYNSLVTHSLNLLGQSPSEWSSSGWKAVNTAFETFEVLGCSLIIVFFLIGLCSESLDVKNEIRFETILKSLIKLSIAEFLVTNSLTLVSSFFGLVSTLTEGITTKKSNLKMSMSDEITKYIQDASGNGISMNWGFAILLLSLIFMLVLIGCGAMIALCAYKRFFNVLLMAPYGALANSTIAGNHMLQQSAVAYWKYALCCILEAVTMILALYISAAIISGGDVSLFGKTENTGWYVCGWIIQSMFMALITVGAVKGSSTVTQRALGL